MMRRGVKYALGAAALLVSGLLAWRLLAPAPPAQEPQGLVGIRVGVSAGPAAGLGVGITQNSVLIVTFGDSNVVGQMDTSKAASEFAVTTPSTTLFDAFYGTASSEPVTMTEFGPTTLRPYGAGGAAGAGFELTLGRTLLGDGGLPHYLLKFAISGTTTAQWAPASTYGQASPQIGGGANLYTALRTRVRRFMAIRSTQVEFVVNLGTNDAGNSTDAGNVATNMTAIDNQLQSDFPGCKVVWIETHSATTNAFTATVRTQQTTYASTAPSWFKLINIDDGVLLGDGLHYDADTYLTVGQRAAFGLIDLLGIPRRTVSVTPAHVGYGTTAYGNSSVTPRYWPGTQAGDLVYAFVLSDWVSAPSGSLATPTGWTLVTSSSSASGGVTSQYWLFSKALVSGDFTNGRPTAVTFSPPGPENAAKLFTWRGASGTDSSAAFVSNTFGLGPISPTGLTTTVDHDSIAYFVGGWSGSTLNENATVAAASGVTGTTEIEDGAYPMPDTNAATISLTTGELAAHTTIGTSTASFATNTVPAVITLAVKP